MTLSAVRIRTAGSWAAEIGSDTPPPAPQSSRGMWVGRRELGLAGKRTDLGGALGEGDLVQESP